MDNGRNSSYQYIDQIYHYSGHQVTYNHVTVGWVVDTNDPQQMGRLRVLCPALGDIDSTPIKHIPWAIYGAPFGGFDDIASRGPGNDKTQGPVAYGMWSIPKIGAYVLVMCIDGNTDFRVWMGCLHGQWLPHTMPHGRFSYQTDNKPDGPLSTQEQPIQPTYNNFTEAFTNSATGVDPRQSFEWRSRGADKQASNIHNEIQEQTISTLPDDENITFTESDGNVIVSTQGYQRSRIEPDLTYASTGINYDSMIYSWTTPGFHSIAMDDQPTNCRMRFRTTGGNQIILDDTNERIYISSAKGKTWIEIDEAGVIDIFAENDISVRANGDINFDSKTFRVHAEEGIHLVSDGEMRLHTKGDDLHIKSNQNIYMESVQTLYINSTDSHINMLGNMYVQTANDMNFTAGVSAAGNFNVITTTDINFTAGLNYNVTALMGGVNLTGATSILMLAPAIHLNGPSPIPAGPVVAPSPILSFESFLTSKVPEHEPWARSYMDLTSDKPSGNSHIPEYPYDSIEVGKGSAARGKTFTRNENWHR